MPAAPVSIDSRTLHLGRNMYIHSTPQASRSWFDLQRHKGYPGL